MDAEIRFILTMGTFIGVLITALHILEYKIMNTKREHNGLLSVFTVIFAILFGFGGKK